HVVLLGAVGVERVAAEGPPQDGEGRREPRSLLVRLCAVLGHGRSAVAIRMPAPPASCPWVATTRSKVHGGTMSRNSVKTASNLLKRESGCGHSALSVSKSLPGSRQLSATWHESGLPHGIRAATSAPENPDITAGEGARSARWSAAGSRHFHWELRTP